MTPEQMQALALAQAKRKRAEAERRANDAPATDLSFEDQIQAKAKEVSDSHRNASVDDRVRSFASGVLGVGSYLDELDAATNAFVAPAIDPLLPDSFEKLPQKTFSERYDKALDIQRGKDKEFAKKNPKADMALKIGGGVTSGLGLLKAAPVAADYVLGNMGRTIGGKMAASTAAGFGTGLVQGFGAGENTVEDRLKQSAKEGIIGALLGSVAIPASSVIGKGYNAAREYATSPKVLDALSGINKDAVRYLEKNLADPAKLAAHRAELERLGPESMLADVSPDWQGVARGAATRPGPREDIVNALTERSRQSNTRLGEDMRQNLGDAIIPSQVKEGIEDSQRLVGELYGPLFENARAVDTRPLAESLEAAVANIRGPEQQAVRNVRNYLDIPGTQELDPNPRALFATRNAIDGLMKNEQNPQVIRQLTMARQQVDDILSDAVPGIKEVDAQYAELSRQDRAMDMGRPILNNEASALRPEEVQQQLTDGALPEGLQIGPSGVPTRMRQSTRAEIERAIGTKANDALALRQIVRGEGDWNRAKLAMMFGDENAERALAAIDREGVFQDTANRVTRGSDTAMANRFGEFLDETAKPKEIPTDTTITGLGIKAARKAANKLLKQDADQMAATFAEDLGNLSVARGDQRDAIIQALMTRGERVQRLNDPKVQALVQALLQTGGRSTYSSLPSVRE